MFNWIINSKENGEAAALLTYGTTNVIEAVDEYSKNHDGYNDKEVRKILSFYKKHRLIKKYKLKIEIINQAMGFKKFNLKVKI